VRLDNIKPGDFLAIRGASGMRSLAKAEVVRTTPTRVHAGSFVFTRRGSMVGAGTWATIWAEPWDEECHPAELEQKRQEMVLRDDRRKLDAFAWQSVTREQADAVLALIASWQETKE
jgi:hypothetical protein